MNYEAILEMNEWSYVDILETVPRSSRWARFSFSIPYNTGNYKVRVVHHGTEGNAEGITQLSTFMDCSWCFGVDVTC